MDPMALKHAKEQLSKAEIAVRALNASTQFKEVESAWSDFLWASAKLYTKLEKGSKTNKKSVAWFGQVKGLRRSDPLLQYVHQARNSDEHGIKDITVRLGTMFEAPMAARQMTGIIGIVVPEGGKLEGMAWGGSGGPEQLVPIEQIKKSDVVNLIAVTDDRYKITYDPPTQHLGKFIGTPSPTEAANLVIAYLAQIILEAESLV